MRWLEELKRMQEAEPNATWTSEPDMEQINCAYLKEIDRLIAIAEMVERLSLCMAKHECFEYNPEDDTYGEEHTKDCPYHEDWKP